jgi:hypothetical protein
MLKENEHRTETDVTSFLRCPNLYPEDCPRTSEATKTYRSSKHSAGDSIVVGAVVAVVTIGAHESV